MEVENFHSTVGTLFWTVVMLQTLCQTRRVTFCHRKHYCFLAENDKGNFITFAPCNSKSTIMNDSVTVLDKTFVKYLSEADIDAAEQRVADMINRDYKDDDVIILITLNGAIFFAVELLKKLHIKCRVSCIKLASYNGTESTNTVQNLIGLTEDLRDQRVLVIEDIVDTGHTYQHITNMLKDSGMRDMRIATLAHKPDAYKLDLPVHYIGINIPNKFVIGHGFDYNGYGRNFPEIYQLKTE